MKNKLILASKIFLFITSLTDAFSHQKIAGSCSGLRLNPCQFKELYGNYPDGVSNAEISKCTFNKGFVTFDGYAPMKKWDEDKDRNGLYRIQYMIVRNDYNFVTTKFIKRTLEQEFAKYTCIKYEDMELQWQQYRSKNYVKIYRGSGCHTGLARPYGPGSLLEQELSLGSGCIWKSTILHELMHTLGWAHEQARNDRDRYITLHLENAVKNAMHEFAKITANDIDLSNTPYDCFSIMQYSSYAYSINGKRTILFHDKSCYKGHGPTFSEWDVYEINTQYICPSKMLFQKVNKQSISSYDWAIRTNHTVVINAIEEYIRKTVTSRNPNCYYHDIERKIAEKLKICVIKCGGGSTTCSSNTVIEKWANKIPGDKVNKAIKAINKRRNGWRLSLAGIDLDPIPANAELQNLLKGKELSRIYLGKCNIATIPTNFLNNLKTVEMISLASNRITILPKNLFKGTPNLKELKLYRNPIKSIEHDFFDNLTYLKFLYLPKTMPIVEKKWWGQTWRIERTSNKKPWYCNVYCSFRKLSCYSYTDCVL